MYAPTLLRPGSILPVLLLTACVPARAPTISAPETDRIIAGAAQQVKKCYRQPRVPTSGRRIVTRLRVRYGVDGALAGLPEIVSQQGVTSENQPYARAMADAASLAVIRCSPLHLPPEYHSGGWGDFYLTFSPRLLA